MTRHQIVHDKKKKYKCDKCSSSFEQRFELESHTKVHTKPDSHIKCAYCDEMFMENSQLVKHIDWHRSGKHPLQCDICTMVFPSAPKLTQHVKEVHDKHYCQICGKGFLYQAELQRHESNAHPSASGRHGQATQRTCNTVLDPTDNNNTLSELPTMGTTLLSHMQTSDQLQDTWHLEEQSSLNSQLNSTGQSAPSMQYHSNVSNPRSVSTG